MGGVFEPAFIGYLDTTEVGSDTITIPVTFTPTEIGTRTGTLTVEGNMDAGDLEIALTGTVEADPIHAKALEKRLPTGAAWHDESMRALLKGLAFEIARTVAGIRSRASIDNLLFGLNLENWMILMNIRPVGTTADKEAAVVRKISDIGGLRAEDLTRELQAAGFPLTVYPNKYRLTPDPVRFGQVRAAFGTATAYFSTLLKYYYKDPRWLEDFIPLFMFGTAMHTGDSPESRFGTARFGFMRDSYGAELVVNSAVGGGDNALWAELDDNKKRWHYAFVIGGNDHIYQMPSIDADRQEELRRLILEIKPLGMWAMLIVKYD